MARALNVLNRGEEERKTLARTTPPVMQSTNSSSVAAREAAPPLAAVSAPACISRARWAREAAKIDRLSSFMCTSSMHRREALRSECFSFRGLTNRGDNRLRCVVSSSGMWQCEGRDCSTMRPIHFRKIYELSSIAGSVGVLRLPIKSR